MRYFVDRSKWYRGKGSESSQLLRKDGTRCCIGFVGQQCGIPDKFMLDKAAVGHGTGTSWPTWFGECLPGEFGMYASVHLDLQQAYLVNDNPILDDASRESQIQAIFASHGDEIVFV